ncbi:MAG: MFS transporter [Planctomycetes bacterium]|nr:MFS transporter [Planctomycetota bacterium]
MESPLHPARRAGPAVRTRFVRPRGRARRRRSHDFPKSFRSRAGGAAAARAESAALETLHRPACYVPAPREPAMSLRREAVVEQNLLALIQGFGAQPRAADPDALLRPEHSLDGRGLIRLFEAQLLSRLLDLEARRLKNANIGFYTIGSSGHEGNAVVGHLLEITDPALLHYRSGAFVMARAMKTPGETPLFDALLSFCASAEDPTSGGRHKVWGSKRLWIPPQTSTIASHLPKAVGMAFGLERAHRLGLECPLPADAIVCCTFGDASTNHASAQTAFNAASWASHQRLPTPILFLCEDNGIGISVKTPQGWIARNFSQRPGIDYFAGDGLDLVDAYATSEAAIAHCRATRRPTFLHLRTVRLLGHAGSDIESGYRDLAEIEASEALDPLLASARAILERGLLTREQILALYRSMEQRVARASQEARTRPKLTTLEQVNEALRHRDPEGVREEAARTDHRAARTEALGGESKLPEKQAKPRPLGTRINEALKELFAKYPHTLLFGEDVAKKGGVYGVTAELATTFGLGRVFNTLLDETMILGMASGFAQIGMLPIPEIQYLAYFHNACDQIRGEAASLQYFSAGQYQNPMLVRIAGFSYQKGFGGHFHNDNSIGALRDIPGIIVATPSRGDDAVRLLRTCAALAVREGAVVLFVEPIAMYPVRDLHEEGDGGWLFPYPPLGEAAEFAKARVHGPEHGAALAIVSYANGFYLSCQAAAILERERGIKVRLVDLQWLLPLDLDTVVREATSAGTVLFVDEARATSGGVSEALMSALYERTGGSVLAARHTAADTFVPLGPAAPLVSPSKESILEAARALLDRRASASPRAHDARAEVTR